ncbi:MAG: hypothetical protein AAF745_01170 [Planctomycetota bacterium]
MPSSSAGWVTSVTAIPQPTIARSIVSYQLCRLTDYGTPILRGQVLQPAT